MLLQIILTDFIIFWLNFNNFACARDTHPMMVHSNLPKPRKFTPSKGPVIWFSYMSLLCTREMVHFRDCTQSDFRNGRTASRWKKFHCNRVVACCAGKHTGTIRTRTKSMLLNILAFHELCVCNCHVCVLKNDNCKSEHFSFQMIFSTRTCLVVRLGECKKCALLSFMLWIWCLSPFSIKFNTSRITYVHLCTC